ncbi:MAG: two-component regulator propeller domain-containing protein [Candidatus Zhuqueibacterota bacterium]
MRMKIQFFKKSACRMKLGFWAIICSLSLPTWIGESVANVNPVEFVRISLDQGLSQSIVPVIHKDRYGFMWFGTQSGLNKYDGYKFIEYKNDPFNPQTISNNGILSIAEDHAGVLWIGTAGGGLNRFDRETETFTRYGHNPLDSTSIRDNTVTYVMEDKQHFIWLATQAGGVDKLDPTTGRFTRYSSRSGDLHSLNHDAVRCGLEDSNGNIWIGTVAGLNKYDPEQDGFIRYQPDKNNPNSLSYDEVTWIHESPREPGILWISTGELTTLSEGGGLNRFDTRTGQFTHFPLKTSSALLAGGNLLGQIHEDAQGNLWICSSQGLVRFDRNSGAFSYFLLDPASPLNPTNFVRSITEDCRGDLWLTTIVFDGIYQFNKKSALFFHHRHDPANPTSLSNNLVISVFNDPAGVLWIGTNTGGLNKLDLYAKKFTRFGYDPTSQNSISNSIVRAFCEDRNGDLWIGIGGGGLNKFESRTKRVRYYQADGANEGSLSHHIVYALLEDRTGALWVGSLGGLDRYNRQSDSFLHYRHQPSDPTTIGSNFIRAIFEDRTGSLWIGTDMGGVSFYNRELDNFTRILNDPDDPYSLSANSVRAIAQDSTGVLWFGTFGGGLDKLVLSPGRIRGKAQSEMFESRKLTFTHYQHDPNNLNSISSNSIQSLYIDKQGIIWIGTFGGGLNRFDPRTETFVHYTENNSELPNNVIYSVLGDDHGNIWVSSNRGLSKFIPETGDFVNYDIDDGLQSKEFNGQAGYRNRNGEMYFGGINGFNVFHPDSIRDNPYEPNIAITDFKLFGESVPIGDDSPLTKHISLTEEVKLAHWQNNISFEFVSLHYNQPEKNRYSYILVNYDAAWREAGQQRTATYTNLGPGEYFFRVRGSNNDGVWNKRGATVKIVISPPYWKTPFAYLCYALMLTGLLFGSYRVQRTVVVKRERARSQLREAELRAQAAEAQARAIQAENERKTHELEKARKLQLSMLPKTLPSMPNLDIAVHMQTATEVGGDYYDFHVDDNGTLTVVIGDATGHGLNAGTLVSVIKSLFIANVSKSDIRTFFEDCTRTIKQLNLGNLYMALSLVRIANDTLMASAAGMPPIYIYRKKTQSVEELVIKGMPLGAFDDFLYADETVRLENGDAVLLLSDGLPELFNENKEVFDYLRIQQIFAEVGAGSPQRIIDHLIEAGEQWRNGRAQNDDITFVVLKVKSIDGVN